MLLSPITAEPRSLSLAEWSSVLRLCSMWCLDDVRLKAMAGADKQVRALDDPIALVLMGKEHRSWEWLKEGYMRLCKRENYLTREEQSKIGFETAARLAEVREASWRWGDFKVTQTLHQADIYSRYTPVSVKVSSRDRFSYNFLQTIREVFEDEFALDKTYPRAPRRLSLHVL